MISVAIVQEIQMSEELVATAILSLDNDLCVHV